MLRRILLLLSLAVMLPLAAPAPAQDRKDDASITRMALEAEDDKGFLTRLLQSRLSGAGRTVQIDGFHGALSSRATFDRITIADRLEKTGHLNRAGGHAYLAHLNSSN